MTKRITLALAMIGLSASAFAGAPGNQVAMPSGINLIAPDSVGVWSFGIEALYFQPANNEYQYGQLVSSPTVANNNARNQSVGNSYDWGGTIDATYLFPGNSRDVKLSYTHIRFSNSDTTSVAGGQAFNPAVNFGIGQLGVGDSARGSQDNDVDSVDLVFGQWIRIGQRVDLHPFGGFRWADISTSAKGSFDSTVSQPIDGGLDYTKLTSSFQGIGPRAGIDTAVHLGKGFSIVGTMAGSLLVGNVDGKYTETDTSGAGGPTPITTVDTVKTGDSTQVVPELDARIGVDYMHAFNPATSMNIQLGWQVVNYFDVSNVDLVDMGTPNTVNNSEDFGYHGPYLRLQVNLA